MMNTESYISSGILELYVMGSLSETERAEVSRLAETYPEIQAEIREIQLSFEQFAEVESQYPNPQIRQRIFEQIQSKISPEQSLQLDHKAPSRWLVAATITLIVGLLLGIVLLFFAYRDLEGRARDTQIVANQAFSRYEELAEQTEDLLGGLPEGVSVEEALQFRQVKLVAPKAGGLQLYWDQEDSKQIYVDASALAELPEGKQYQLWAIVKGKAPASAGTFDGNQLNWIELDPINEGTTFAITVEPKGGSSGPTSDIILIGNI